jgi:hypothetical protein
VMVEDKIPIGKYKCMRSSSGIYHYYVEVKFKDGIPLMNNGDIITLDMIEPYESAAVRKVADYLEYIPEKEFEDKYYYKDHAKEIVRLVHEAEDADE